VNKISIEQRKKVFDLLCRDSSPDFIKYLRAYEGIPRPPSESFEISCELINGIRNDSARLAVFDICRQDVLRWLSACQRQVPLIQDLLFENATDECFMIGLADYPSSSRGCRFKIYNEYSSSLSQIGDGGHAQRLFSLLNISDVAFKKDLDLFKKVKIAAIEWDHQQRAIIKVYFGNFHLEQLFTSFSEALFKDELLCYDNLRKKALLPEIFHICVRYSPQGRSIKMEFNCQTRRVVPYFEMFDQQRQAAKFFADLFRITPGLRLEFLSVQWLPAPKVQYYFLLQ